MGRAALYVGFDVYSNFLEHKSGIFGEKLVGGKKGGHAVALVGYGKDAKKKYWIIQNSWGPTWAESGFAKFKRGSNTAGIEEKAYYPRAWIEGGRKPECVESGS